MSIIIAGGGIGGLITALALHQKGIAASLHEQVGEIRPLGVGINLLPHAVRVLTGLGLADRLAAAAVRTRELTYFNKLGQLIWSEPRGLDAGYDYPQFSIHRGTLQTILLEEAVARLGPERIRLGERFAGATETSDGKVEARFTGRNGDEVARRQADVLIGADGIHSAVRAALYPGEGAPIWNGRVLWRAITEDFRPFLSGRTMIMAGHQDRKFVCYPLTTSPDGAGPVRINWIAELSFDRSKGWRREDWDRTARLEDIAPLFADWRFDWLDIPALMAGAQTIYEYPLVDRDPLERWSFGPVTLMGDAAHPMYPIGSNGASQAILDAEALANAIARLGPTPEALLAYEAERRPPTSAIVLANRGNGPEQVMQLAEERAPHGFADVHDVISRAELEDISARYKQVAGFSRDKVNRPSGG
ncbi:flavin-dependent oxidoreductase [Phreatobacter stygius]|uniref:Flavin-dependent oxidoreductase n=1 Tax=Phreatobacter stygius TaxID=1940610 RepID=A0A4D7AZF7_9HYPH|nr:flavin-dependent oxidoreductase [Phreatobacter stygius]QCI66834.1 flavin-dependent oxidoreductase [Phreatobacter stygius]